MDNLESFRQQYGALYEALVGDLCYQFSKSGQWPALELSIQGYQLTDVLPRSLHIIKLRFTGIKAFFLVEKPNASGIEMLYGISYLFKDGHYHFDFTNDCIASAEIMQQHSDFYIMSEGFSYEVMPSIN